jgi:hypothetical protein
MGDVDPVMPGLLSRAAGGTLLERTCMKEKGLGIVENAMAGIDRGGLGVQLLLNEATDPLSGHLSSQCHWRTRP